MARKQIFIDLVTNPKAHFDYEILEKFDAGLVLKGAEVKSLKQSKASLVGSYIIIRNGQAYLLNATISPYQPNNLSSNYQPQATRKLLLKRQEIESLSKKIKERGLTLVPLKVYNKNGLLKLEFALAKGKKKFDKREAIKKRESQRKILRAQNGEY